MTHTFSFHELYCFCGLI